MKLFSPNEAAERANVQHLIERTLELVKDLETMAESLGLDFNGAFAADALNELQTRLYAADLNKGDIREIGEMAAYFSSVFAALNAALIEFHAATGGVNLAGPEKTEEARESLQMLLALFEEMSISPSFEAFKSLSDAGNVAAGYTAAISAINRLPAHVINITFSDKNLAAIAKAPTPKARATIGLAMIEEFYESEEISDIAKARPELIIKKMKDAGILDEATVKEAELAGLPEKLIRAGKRMQDGELTLEDGREEILGLLAMAAFDLSKELRNDTERGIENALLSSIDLDAGKEEAKKKYIEQAEREQSELQEASARAVGNPISVGPVKSRWTLEKEFEDMWGQYRQEQEYQWKNSVRTAVFDVKKGLAKAINDIEGTRSFKELLEKQEHISEMLAGKGERYSLDTLFEITRCKKTYLSGANLARGLLEAKGMHQQAMTAAAYFTEDTFGERADLNDDSTIDDAIRVRQRFEEQIASVEKGISAAKIYIGVGTFYITVTMISMASMAGGFVAQAAEGAELVAEGGVGSFLIDSTVFGATDIGLCGAALEEYPKTWFDVVVKMAHTYAIFGSLRGMGKWSGDAIGDAKLGWEIINDAEKFASLDVGAAKVTKELRAVAKALGTEASAADAIVTDALQLINTSMTLQAASGGMGVIGLGEIPQGIGSWQDILTLAILHGRGRLKATEGEKLFSKVEQFGHNEAAEFIKSALAAKANGRYVEFSDNSFRVYEESLNKKGEIVRKLKEIHHFVVPSELSDAKNGIEKVTVTLDKAGKVDNVTAEIGVEESVRSSDETIKIYTFTRGDETVIQESLKGPYIYRMERVYVKYSDDGRGIEVGLFGEGTKISVNGMPVKNGARVVPGDVVEWMKGEKKKSFVIGQRDLKRKDCARKEMDQVWEKNIKMIYSKAFIDMYHAESMNGGSGKFMSTVNAAFDPETGEIKAIGNPDRLPKDLADHPIVSLTMDVRQSTVVKVSALGRSSEQAKKALLKLVNVNILLPMEWYLDPGNVGEAVRVELSPAELDANRPEPESEVFFGVATSDTTAFVIGAGKGSYFIEIREGTKSVARLDFESDFAVRRTRKGKASNFEDIRKKAEALFEKYGLNSEAVAERLFNGIVAEMQNPKKLRDLHKLVLLETYIAIFGADRFHDAAVKAFPKRGERDRFINKLARYADDKWLTKNYVARIAAYEYGRIINDVAARFRELDHPTLVAASAVVSGAGVGARKWFSGVLERMGDGLHKMFPKLSKVGEPPDEQVIAPGLMAIYPGMRAYSVQTQDNTTTDYQIPYQIITKVLIKYEGRMHELDRETFFREVDAETNDVKARWWTKGKYEDIIENQGIPSINALYWDGSVVVMDGNHRFSALGYGYPLLARFESVGGDARDVAAKSNGDVEPYRIGSGRDYASNFNELLQQQLKTLALKQNAKTKTIYEDMNGAFMLGGNGSYLDAISKLRELLPRLDAIVPADAGESQLVASLRSEVEKRIDFFEKRSKSPPPDPAALKNEKPSKKDVEVAENAIYGIKEREGFIVRLETLGLIFDLTVRMSKSYGDSFAKLKNSRGREFVYLDSYFPDDSVGGARVRGFCNRVIEQIENGPDRPFKVSEEIDIQSGNFHRGRYTFTAMSNGQMVIFYVTDSEGKLVYSDRHASNGDKPSASNGRQRLSIALTWLIKEIAGVKVQMKGMDSAELAFLETAEEELNRALNGKNSGGKIRLEANVVDFINDHLEGARITPDGRIEQE